MESSSIWCVLDDKRRRRSHRMCIVYNRLRLSSELQPVLSSREILSSSLFSYCETVEEEPTAAKQMDSSPKDAGLRVVKG